ncbi:hypothetical protein LguiA_025594 [Lonicera macranthoides]
MEDHMHQLAELIRLGFLVEFDEEAIEFLMKTKNLQLFDLTRLMIFAQLWKTITSSSELQMSPRFRPRLHFNALYNFRVLAESQFQLLEAQKCVRSRAIDQKLNGARPGLGSRLHEQ